MMGGTTPAKVSVDYLRRLLREAGLTQLAAADLIDVSLRTMQRYLTDEHAGDIRRPALALLQQAASAKGSITS